MKLEKKYLVLMTVCMSTFMATIDSSIVNISLPVMARALGVSLNSIQWVVSSYLMTITAFLLFWGKLSDLYSRKKLFIGGFAVFTLGSLICALSNALPMLVGGRLIQALGASITMALVQGIVTLIFPVTERGKALGVVSTVVALGSLTGPSVGGLLVHFWGWPSIFSINLPIGVIGVIMAYKILPDHFEHSSQQNGGREELGQKKTFDFWGSGIFALMILLMFMGLLGNQDGLVSRMHMWLMLGVSALLFIVFIWREKHVQNPMLDLNMFKIWDFSSGVLAAYISFLSLFSYMLLMPFYLQGVQGYDVLKSGLLMAIYPLALAICAPNFGKLSDRISYKPLTIGGLSLNGIALILLAFSKGDLTVWALGGIILMLGVGSAMFQSPNTSSIMGSVPRTVAGIAGSINAFFRNFGMVTGTTLAVIIFGFTTGQSSGGVTFQNLEPTVFLLGFKWVMLTAAFLSFLGVGLSALRGRKG